MKTKIIYISGNEIFDAADIRAAFDEVRGALNLSADTVLFGVPVDSDDAGLATVKIPEPMTITAPEIEELDILDETEPQIIIDAPKKKSRKTTVKSKKTDEPIAENITPDQIEITTDTVAEAAPESEKIIPILSILSGKKEEPEMEINDDVTIESVVVEKVTIHDAHSETPTVTTETIAIADIMTDDAPSEPEEKTLEKLFEKIAPLREDHGLENIIAPQEPEVIMDDTDATLEKLAAEFASNQDISAPAPKSESAGKIGKLKNILPFKKAKREESGLMGDLFGWAGIAANDDEFSIPGFFTTASKK